MQRDEIKELHYITHLDNIPSILRRGILSHRAAQRIPHETVYDEDVQARRDQRAIPDRLRLHQYANLCFCARNAMLYSITHQRGIPCEELAVIRIAPAVLDLPDVIITEINAAADIKPRWHAATDGLPKLDASKIYVHSWNHYDLYEKGQRRRHMMAEVLVPHQVHPEQISGAYVVSQAVADNLSQAAPTLENIMVLPYVFFRGARPEHLPYLPAGGETR